MSRDFAGHSESMSAVDYLLFPFRFIWGFLVFMVFAWTTSRNGRPFLLAIPAILGVTCFVAAAWAVGFKGKTIALTRSLGAYNRLKEPEEPTYDPDSALMFAKKMAEIDPNEKFFMYEMALSYERIGETDRAVEVMEYLAPGPGQDSARYYGDGFSHAHLWLAGNYWTAEDIDETLRKELSREHMELAYETNKLNVLAVLGNAGFKRDEAERLRTEIEQLRAEGDNETADNLQRREEEVTKDAVRLFNEGIDLNLVSDRQLYASLALIEILQQRGKHEEARLTGMRFINKHERNANLLPDVLPFWISIVRTCILIDDFDRAQDFIKQGYQLARDPNIRSILAQLAAQIEVEKSKTFTDMEDESDFMKRLFALCKAIKTNVQIVPAYDSFLYYIDGFETGSKQDFWLRDAILGTDFIDRADQKDPRIPGVIHVVLGFREIVDGNKNEGLKHWEIAGQQFQFAPLAINYMLQIYSKERELDRDKRIYLVTSAIEQFPQSPFFFATRGRFHIDDEEFESALKDLQFADARIPGNLNILENLLECYKKMDELDGEEKYKSEIEDIELQIDRIKKSLEEPEGDELSTFFSPAEGV